MKRFTDLGWQKKKSSKGNRSPLELSYPHLPEIPSHAKLQKLRVILMG
jgi:hypothetical protein